MSITCATVSEDDPPPNTLSSAESTAGGSPRRRPTWRERRAEARRRRRARGVVRRIDPWSVFKVSLVFYIAMYCILVVAGVLLWSAATATGFRANVENFIAGLIESGEFRFVASELFRASVIGGAVLAAMGTGANVLFVVLYNLISDVVGGIVFVVEEKPGRRALEGANAEGGDGEAPAPVPSPPAPELTPVPQAAAAAAAASVMPGAIGAASPVGSAGTAAAPPAALVGDFGLGTLPFDSSSSPPSPDGQGE